MLHCLFYICMTKRIKYIGSHGNQVSSCCLLWLQKHTKHIDMYLHGIHGNQVCPWLPVTLLLVAIATRYLFGCYSNQVSLWLLQQPGFAVVASCYGNQTYQTYWLPQQRCISIAAMVTRYPNSCRGNQVCPCWLS